MKPGRASRLVLATALVASGCAVGPDYVRPTVDVPQAYRFSEEPIDVPQAQAAYWWSQMNDPVLDGLIATARANNKDLLIAAARVEEYYGRLMTTRSGLFPQVGVEAGGGRQRLSTKSGTAFPLSNPFNSVRADVFASWEIDLFGRVRRLTEGAKADWQSSEHARRATEISVIAATASAYITLRDLDNRLRISKDTLESRRGAMELFKERFEGGVVSETEYAQARSEYSSALTQVESFRQQVALQEDLLSGLIGENPRDIPRGKPIDQLTVPGVPVGLPSTLLEQRPDLLQAEQNLVAANARIGAARAEYFPTITLTGLFGAASTSLSGLWTGAARTWSFAGLVSMPIFTGGAIAGDVKQAEAIQTQALQAYQQSIQTAFREVADALVSVQRTRDQLNAKNDQVDALSRYASLARDRYEGGYTSYLEVLDSERALFSAQLDQSTLIGDEFNQLVQLYKALGGGWPVNPDGTDATQAPQANLAKPESRDKE